VSRCLDLGFKGLQLVILKLSETVLGPGLQLLDMPRYGISGSCMVFILPASPDILVIKATSRQLGNKTLGWGFLRPILKQKGEKQSTGGRSPRLLHVPLGEFYLPTLQLYNTCLEVLVTPRCKVLPRGSSRVLLNYGWHLSTQFLGVQSQQKRSHHLSRNNWH
jgi:hypothetical protein